jgi:ATP phosphoribosyltransferase
MPLRIALPNKGRLADGAAGLMDRAGIHVRPPNDRMLIHNVPGGEIRILYSRTQDIPEILETGAADVGITGLDLVEESGCNVVRILDLNFGHCKLVVAAPENSKFADLESLPAHARVATAFPNLTRRYFAKHRKGGVRIVPITGAAEIAPHIGVADLITDLTETGTTLRQNHLTLVDVIMDSWAVLVAAPAARRRHGDAIDELRSALQSVLNASKRRYLMANAPRKNLTRIEKMLPGLSAPTVMELATRGMVAVHAVVEEHQINRLIPQLKKAGASGILVLPIERLVP